METIKKLDGIMFARMINSGALNLKAHAQEINDLNVFPIPDGDTGDNMLLTIMGGVNKDEPKCEKLCRVAETASSGMLLAARGNSGVILSQFFEGMKNGFSGIDNADVQILGEAFKQGVNKAYSAVMVPTEGTILTVARETTEYALSINADTPKEFFNAFIKEAKESLERTPKLLPVLKKAGVVDSGAAGLICIVEGMVQGMNGEIALTANEVSEKQDELDFDAFGEDSVLKFGYCTELLVRLQSKKCDIATFDVKNITDYLQTIGESIVTVRNGSLVKIHVHTMTPDKVLHFCQRYGEFLKVKIENMTLQHNNTVTSEETSDSSKPKKKYGIVAVASGEGLRSFFLERGADVIVEGGQSMNPSTEEFLEAFRNANAETVFVFPNNSNIVLTAKQAANLYGDADVRVIESKTIGAGYAALSMFDENSGDADAIAADLTEAMNGVVTAEVSHCVRDAMCGGTKLHRGDYIGFVGKELLAAESDRVATVETSLDKLSLNEYDICILIYGKDVKNEEASEIERYIYSKYPGKEIFTYSGMQTVYDYIMILE